VNFRTTCPQCASVFRLGADQLDAAQGWVQCGVCGAAFDARPDLLMEDGSPLPPVEPVAVEAPPPLQEAVPAAEQAACEPVPVDMPETAPAEETSAAGAGTEDSAGADTPRGIVQRETSLDLPSIILIDPDIPVHVDPGPLPQIYPPPAEPAARPSSPAAEAAPAARIEYAAPAVATPSVPRRPRKRWARSVPSWAWPVANALLLMLLLAQAAYFLRDTVVSRLPQTRPAFEQICAALGCTLSLPKDLTQLRIVGSDLQTESSGRLQLTLTLGNRAGHAQAWPVLVLTLTDQRNRPLARRSFAPSEYLGDAQRLAAGIPPRSEHPLSLPLSVRDLAPMGFDLRLSY
jgi:predicted Zn finger-like uncharacterized protein